MATLSQQIPLIPSCTNRLLSLDCSSDLESYRCDLGLNAQVRPHKRPNQVLQVRLKQHRDSLQHHQQDMGAELVPQLLPLIPVPNVATRNIAHDATINQPLPYFPSRPYPQPVPRIDSIDPNTYPPALREALERACATVPATSPSNAIYQVMHHIDSAYIDNKTNVIKTCKSLRQANVMVAKWFIGNLWQDPMGGAEYEVQPGGQATL